MANENTVKVIKELLRLNTSNKKLIPDLDKKETNLLLTLKKYCTENSEEFGLLKDRCKHPELFAGLTDSIYFPHLKQFRVYWDNTMKSKGMSSHARSTMMNHKDPKMIDYYGRDMQTEEDNFNFSKFVFKETIVKDYSIFSTIGNSNTKIRGRGEQNKKMLKSQIKDDEYKNIEANLESIIERVSGHIPIRQKSDDFCIMANPTRECIDDGYSNQYLCKYGLCMNRGCS